MDEDENEERTERAIELEISKARQECRTRKQNDRIDPLNSHETSLVLHLMMSEMS